MSSEMEENFISQNQFTVILAMDTSQSKGRAVHIAQSTTDTTVME
jgi:hypothetical protein